MEVRMKAGGSLVLLLLVVLLLLDVQKCRAGDERMVSCSCRKIHGLVNCMKTIGNIDSDCNRCR